ncbi:MAG: transposase [Chlamydiae bacterium]|nr:transposase [Chlamydiota bacterium]MBI3267140.1 transposase [Chlamydiota bacterium]
MPRHRRLNLSGAVYHVITRGIERRDIFLDSLDYNQFLSRMAQALEDTQCKCYAWALMPNHLHLLLRPLGKSLSEFMRKILTGYAIYFNRRHQRAGYLYQNRYKSVLCEEEVYFLELVRYIHLNPVRANLVRGMTALDVYPWTGHAVLMGNQEKLWQNSEEVLSRFSRKRYAARLSYHQYIEDGLAMGERNDLMGGGLRRSAGGWTGVSDLRKNKEYWRGDDRILGNGQFVEGILKATEEQMERREALIRKGWNLEKIVEKVCSMFDVKAEELKNKGRSNALSKAKGLISYWGYHDLGINGRELAQFLGMSRAAISKAIKRGEEYSKSESIILN